MWKEYLRWFKFIEMLSVTRPSMPQCKQKSRAKHLTNNMFLSHKKSSNGWKRVENEKNQLTIIHNDCRWPLLIYSWLLLSFGEKKCYYYPPFNERHKIILEILLRGFGVKISYRADWLKLCSVWFNTFYQNYNYDKDYFLDASQKILTYYHLAWALTQSTKEGFIWYEMDSREWRT